MKNKIINLVKWVAKIHKSVLLWLLEKIVHGHRRLWVGTGLSRALLDFNLAICYAGMKGRVRPEAAVRPTATPANSSNTKCMITPML